MVSLRILVVYEGAHPPVELLALLTEGAHSALTVAGLTAASDTLSNQHFDAVLLQPDYDGASLERFAFSLRELDGRCRPKSRTVLLSCASTPPEHPCVDLHLSAPEDFAELADIVGELASFRVISSEPPPEPTGELSVFEPDGFEDQCAQDAELMVEIIDLFAAECAEELPALASSLAAGDFECGSRLAHSMKGSLGSLHAARARRHAAALEMAARERNADACSRSLTSLRAEISALQEHLSSFRQTCLCR